MRKAKLLFIALRARHTRTAKLCHFRLPWGKDSIRYHNKVAVDEQVFRDIKIFEWDKKDPDG